MKVRRTLIFYANVCFTLLYLKIILLVKDAPLIGYAFRGLITRFAGKLLKFFLYIRWYNFKSIVTVVINISKKTVESDFEKVSVKSIKKFPVAILIWPLMASLTKLAAIFS